jgi:hypothetical protein
LFTFHESCMLFIMNGKDALVILKIHCSGGRGPYQALSGELGLSVGAVHQSVREGLRAGLLVEEGHRVVTPAFREWVLYGVKYFFPLTIVGVGRGLATGLSVSPFADAFHSSAQMGWVWPDADGEVKGELVQPLAPAVPFAARKDPMLYKWLVVLDVIRGGNMREKKMAEDWVLEESLG